MKQNKKMPLYVKILIGMFLGGFWGLLALKLGLGEFTLDWIKPWGTVFLNLLKLIAVPLIFVSIVNGITSLTDVSKLSRIGFKTIGLYLFTTVLATFLGLFLVNQIEPGKTFPTEKRKELLEQFKGSVKNSSKNAQTVKESSPLQVIVDIVPENIVSAASDNSKMLQIIFFAAFFAIAMVLLPLGSTETVKSFFSEFSNIILRMIDMIMEAAPFGVFALMSGLVVDFSGDSELFTALGFYGITVILGLFAMIFFVYPVLLWIFTSTNVLKFYKNILPAQLVAFSTSSSAATLPVTMEQCREKIGVSNEICSFVLPLGVTINMDGTSAYQAIAAVFIAQVFDIELSITAQLTIVLTAVLSSIGSPGVPGGSVVMLIIVLSSVGIPVEGLALILGIDRPLDMLRTVVNVTGDAVVATIIDKNEKSKTDL
jgi:Na+/H+-dicarboxylate symporter